MRTISRIFIHCAYTPADMDIGVQEITKWHTDPPPKGKGWADIGYHYVIRRNGVVEKGRPIEEEGAHAKGHNGDSIGICLVGGKIGVKKAGFNFTRAQMVAVEEMCAILCVQYKLTFNNIHGHNEVSNRDCPCFDVQAYLNWEIHAKEEDDVGDIQ